jgi:hypothetical protein
VGTELTGMREDWQIGRLADGQIGKSAQERVPAALRTGARWRRRVSSKRSLAAAWGKLGLFGHGELRVPCGPGWECLSGFAPAGVGEHLGRSAVGVVVCGGVWREGGRISAFP